MVNTKIRVITLCEAENGEAYTVSKTISGADGGSDHKLLDAKFKFKLKIVEKTITLFRYDLNQITYNDVV